MHMNEWQNEFPNLYSLKHNPKVAIADLLCSFETKLRKVITYVTLGLIAWGLQATLMIYYAAKVTSLEDIPMGLHRAQFSHVLDTWTVWRNILLFFMLVDFGVLIICSVLRIYRKQYPKLVKSVLGFVFLIAVLIPFSYPLAVALASVIASFTTLNFLPPKL